MEESIRRNTQSADMKTLACCPTCHHAYWASSRCFHCYPKKTGDHPKEEEKLSTMKPNILEAILL